MEPKAFDLSVLGKKLLGSLKAVAPAATEVVIDWTAEGCALSGSAIVKGIGGVLVAVKPTILVEVKKAVE